MRGRENGVGEVEWRGERVAAGSQVSTKTMKVTSEDLHVGLLGSIVRVIRANAVALIVN